MKVKKQGWINIYYHADINGNYNDADGPWSTRKAAREAVDMGEDPADTIQIEWEEEV